jgi:hypothetical protein
MPSAATASGLNTAQEYPLWNCTDITILTPSFPQDYTVYRNIMYESCRLKVGQQNMPNFDIRTVGPTFAKMAFLSSDLEEFGLAPTEEFEESLTEPRNNKNGERCLMESDATSFVLNFQCERGGGGIYFDGLYSRGVPINVEIKGKPIYNKLDGFQDTYFFPDPDFPNMHPPQPIIVYTNDALFTFRANESLVFQHDKDIEKILRDTLAEN